MISAVKADDFKAALLKAGLTDEVLAEGEPALDAILNKVGDLSQVQRVRLKQWYRKNMIVKPAAAPKAEAEEAKPAAPEVTYTPEEMAAIEAVKKQMRKPQEMLTPISEWLYGKIIQQRKEFDAQQKSVPLAVRAAQNFGERLEVLADRISRHWRDKYRDSEIQTHIASAAFDFHPKESMVWLELYMQRFMGYKRYKAAPGQSIAKVNFYLMIRHLRESRAKRIAARDALAAKLGFENPIQKNFTDEKVAQYHASGVEALSFIRGEFDGNRADLVRVHRWLSLWLFAVFLLVAAVLVCAMGDRLSGRKNGVLGLIRAYRIGAISAIRKAPEVLDGAKKRAEPVLGLRVEAPRSWKSLV